MRQANVAPSRPWVRAKPRARLVTLTPAARAVFSTVRGRPARRLTCCPLRAQLLLLLQPLLHEQLHHPRLALLRRQRLAERLARVRHRQPRRACQPRRRHSEHGERLTQRAAY